VAEFVNTCSLIGEEELKKKDRENGCIGESLMLRSKARMWNRKLKCLKIYTSMSTFYSPFDPCTGIRTIVQFAPMSVCQAAPVKCVPPPSEDEYDFIPFFAKNMSMPNEMPPLQCPQYVADLEGECRSLKSKDFYHRSILDSFCLEKYGAVNTHQVSGCETVRAKLVARDYMMDLCGSLHAVPIPDNYETYCNATLLLPSDQSVPDAGYAAYLERVALFKDAWILAPGGKNDITLSPIRFPAGDRVLTFEAEETVPPVKVETVTD